MGAMGWTRWRGGRRRALALALVASVCASDVGAEEGARSGRDESTVGASPAGEAGFLDTPPFPGLDVTGAFRADVGTLYAPEARVGRAHVSLVRPQLGMRLDGPLTERLVVRVAVRTGANRYRFRGRPTNTSSLLDDLDLYAARISLEGSYLLEIAPWFADDEVWSLLGSISARSRWEDGDFGAGVSGTAAIGFGYAIPDRLRVGLGVSLRTSLEEGDLEPGPFVSIRWDVTDRFTVRTHDFGLRLEYDLTPALELHLTGSRTNDGFELKRRAGVPDDLSFRDRYLRFAGGADWTLANWLRLDFAVGATAERRLRVSGEDLGTLVSERVDPSLFFDVRIEVRL
jgi:hypothetical protein